MQPKTHHAKYLRDCEWWFGVVHATNAQAGEGAKFLSAQNKVATDADADFNGSSEDISGYDAGMNVNKDGSLNNPALSGLKVVLTLNLPK